MNRKVCPECNKNSYSSMTMGRWLCPHCKSDLSNEPVLLPEREGEPRSDRS